MSHNFEQLKVHILSLSVSRTWDAAVQEWYLESVEHLGTSDKGGECAGETCPCSHHPIFELCWMRNSRNGNQTFVGNVCVTRFIDASANGITQGMKRVQADVGNALNEDAILWARRRGWLTEWELKFCLNTRLKRRLTGGQQDKREEINAKVLSRAADVAAQAAALTATARQARRAVGDGEARP